MYIPRRNNRAVYTTWPLHVLVWLGSQEATVHYAHTANPNTTEPYVLLAVVLLRIIKLWNIVITHFANSLVILYIYPTPLHIYIL
jgi:hypothetical protein